MSWLGQWLGRSREPAPAARGDTARIDEVRAVLADVSAWIAADGGRVELISVEDGWVHLRFLGACAHCHASDQTLKGLLEPRLRAALPWFQGLRAS